MNRTALSLTVLASLGFCVSAWADVVPADAKPFAGSWAIDFQNPKKRRNFADATCPRPATIEATADDVILVCQGEGCLGSFEVKEFGGKMPWWSTDPQGPIFVAEWLDDDTFILAGKDGSGIKTDWPNAKQWTRCPG